MRCAGIPSADRFPDLIIPATPRPIAALSLATAATGAAALSRAQLSPPNAILDVPIAADAYAISAPTAGR
jgi:hypothetical protein